MQVQQRYHNKKSHCLIPVTEPMLQNNSTVNSQLHSYFAVAHSRGKQVGRESKWGPPALLFFLLREADVIVVSRITRVLSRSRNLQFRRFLGTGSERNVQKKALTLLLLSPSSPKPKKNKRETLNYPSKLLSNLNRISCDIQHSVLGENYHYISLPWEKKN